MTPIAEESLAFHAQKRGKIEVISTVKVNDAHDLSVAYTPGVAQPCLEIQKDVDQSYELTRRWNMAAVITDGTAVLGLGDIGPEAGMPVMEGKCVLFKEFGGVDAFPLCIKSKDVDEIVRTVYLISGSFGAINLEDISAPRCFEIEARLKELCDIPVFHDDQHGTAVIALAGMTNALKVVGKKREEVKVVINGAGAAGMSVCRLLLRAGFSDITLCDKSGIICQGYTDGMNSYMVEMAKVTNRAHRRGTLADALVGADAFLGFSAPGFLPWGARGMPGALGAAGMRREPWSPSTSEGPEYWAPRSSAGSASDGVAAGAGRLTTSMRRMVRRKSSYMVLTSSEKAA